MTWINVTFAPLLIACVSVSLDGGVVCRRSLISSDGNVQHVVVLSSSCPDAFMMLSINLHLQKAVSWEWVVQLD